MTHLTTSETMTICIKTGVTRFAGPSLTKATMKNNNAPREGAGR